MNDKIQVIVDSAIRDRIFPSCVVGVVTKSGERNIVARGNFTYESGAPEIEANSIFDIASISKSIPTSCLALQLIEQKKLRLDQPIIEFLPELKMSAREKITVQHLLTQALDWGFSLSSVKNKTADEILDTIFGAEFRYPPGVSASYSNATSILLGLVVERAAGQPLDILADEGFFQPLGMTRTSFHPEKFPLGEIAPTEIDAWRGRLLRGEIHDESAWKLRHKIIPGSAGVFSTAPDLLNFMEMLLRGGELNGRRYFTPETIKQMSRGLGWDLNKPAFMGNRSETIFGKTGFTGCMALGDLTQGKALVMLSNHIYPHRLQNYDKIHAVRGALANYFFAASTTRVGGML
jgi:CubicO group peptidase (beta-lactamase class C family)